MRQTINLAGPPSRWVATGGRPARVLDGEPAQGMPSFETDAGLVVFDLLVAFRTTGIVPGPELSGVEDSMMLIPRMYGEVAFRSAVVGDHELVSLHDAPDARWEWRPLAYRLSRGGLGRLGSQQELQWRWGLAEVERRQLEMQGDLADLADDCARQGLTFDDYKAVAGALIAERRAESLEQTLADARARAVLLDHLAPQQRLDMIASGLFYSRGTINRLYRVEPGNGCAIVHPDTRQPLVSICVHPERWMPHDDVALATKLLIESGLDTERELLEGGRARPVTGRTRATRRERQAWRLERDLLPAPLAEVA